MNKRAVFPPHSRCAAERLKMSPGILADGFLFLTGVTGGDARGDMPEDPEVQFRNCFSKILLVLQEVGLTFDDVVEMTTYHVGLREHFDRFDAIRLENLGEPYPAWTAIEVAGLRRDGAVVEIRAIAKAAKLPPA
jgi:enamine deaminase RidA (YjgF/YER057c/UK114 family)